MVGTLQVAVAGQASNPIAYDFISLIRPAMVLAVRPLEGPVAGGALVTVLGSGFGDAAVVLFVGVGDVEAGTATETVECSWRNAPGTLVCEQ